MHILEYPPLTNPFAVDAESDEFKKKENRAQDELGLRLIIE